MNISARHEGISSIKCRLRHTQAAISNPCLLIRNYLTTQLKRFYCWAGHFIKKIVPKNKVYFPLDTYDNVIDMTTEKTFECKCAINIYGNSVCCPRFQFPLDSFAKFMQSKHFLQIFMTTPWQL